MQREFRWVLGYQEELMDEPSVFPHRVTQLLEQCSHGDASSRVTIHESLVTIPISATESGEALESGVASVSESVLRLAQPERHSARIP